MPAQYERLLEATLPWAVGIALVVFTLFRLEQKQWRYTGHRDYVAIGQAVVVTTLSVAGIIALTKPVTVRSTTGDIGVTAPTGVLVLFALLMLVLNGGARFVARDDLRAPAERLPGAA